MEEITEKLYKVYKIGRKYGMSGRRQLLGKNLSREAAQRIVRSYPNASKSMVIFTEQVVPIRYKPTLRDRHPEFKCVCGHLAYWVARRGYHCMCNNPRKFNP